MYYLLFQCHTIESFLHLLLLPAKIVHGPGFLSRKHSFNQGKWRPRRLTRMVTRLQVQHYPRRALPLPQKECLPRWSQWRILTIRRNPVRGLLLRPLLARIFNCSHAYRQSPKQVQCHGKESHQARFVFASQIPRFPDPEMVRKMSQYNT